MLLNEFYLPDEGMKSQNRLNMSEHLKYYILHKYLQEVSC
jgi:hypothetical protein